MEAHPLATLFPMMTDEELTALAEDIRRHGLREPITVWQGRILDGRNRWRACELAGVTPQTVEWDGQGSPLSWVLSKNLYRRHLTASQRAAIAVEVKERFAEDVSVQHRMTVSTDMLSPFTRIVNVSDVEEARRVKAKSPALFEELLKGSVTVASASSMLYWQERQQAEAERAAGRTTAAALRRAPAGGGVTPTRPARSDPSQSLYDVARVEQERAARRARERSVQEVRSLTRSMLEVLQDRETCEPAVVAAALQESLGQQESKDFAKQLGHVAFFLACIAHDLGYRPEAEMTAE